MVIVRVRLNIPVTAGTLSVLAILHDGGPLPVAVKPCTVKLNSVSAIRPVARYFSASLTVALTENVSFSNMDSFTNKTNSGRSQHIHCMDMITTAIPNCPSTTSEQGPRLVFAMAMKRAVLNFSAKVCFLKFVRERSALSAFS